MKQEHKKQFALNTASGLASQLTATIVGVVLLRYCLFRLGDEHYGLFQLARTVFTFFLFLRLGMGPTLSRFFSLAAAKGDMKHFREVNSCAQMILTLLGIIGSILLIAGIPLFFRIYDVPEAMRTDVGWMLVFLAGSLLVSMIGIAPGGMLIAKHRYDIGNGLSILMSLTRLVLTIGFFELIDISLSLMALAMFLSLSLRVGFVFFFSRRLMGSASRWSRQSVNTSTLRSLFGFSLMNFTNIVAVFFVVQGPLLIIGVIPRFGPTAVALLAPAILIATSLQAMLGRLSGPLVPLASQAKADNDPRRLGSLSMQIAACSLCVGLFVAIPLLVFGHELLTYWIGFERSQMVAGIAALMAMGTVLSRSASSISFVALGGGSILPEVYSQIVLAVVTMGGVCWGLFFMQWSLWDTVLFMVVCRCIRNAGYLPMAYAKQFAFSFSEYCKTVYLAPLLLTAVIVAVGYGMRQCVAEQTLYWLISEVMILWILLATGIYLFVLPENMRHTILRRLGLKRTVGREEVL